MTHGHPKKESSPEISTGLLLSGAQRQRLAEGGPGVAGELSGLDGLIDARGRAALDDFSRLRQLIYATNQRFLAENPRSDEVLEVGRVGAVACLNSVWRRLMERWRVQVNPTGFDQALAYLRARFGEASVQELARGFAQVFPTEARRAQPDIGAISLGEELEGSAAFVADFVTVYLLNENPAVELERRLFDDAQVPRRDYERMMGALEAFFEAQPPISGVEEAADSENTRSRESSLLELPLISLLRAPIERGGDSLFDQLAFIERHFADLLPAALLKRVLSTLDVLREEAKGRWSGPPGPGPLETPSFMGLEALGARFSPDADWMGELVLLAKNVHVWLAQLSRRKRRELKRLDQIPDEELAALKARGIDGLWLIGIWERSAASRRIKELSGSPHVVSSAYSIYDYQVAQDLGGEQAWERLRERAASFGVRMAADMVPNHMGISSRWVFEHPEWFIRRADPPYPSYTFDGEDLSDDGRVGIYLEDHYYRRADAAVVFKRVDHASGDVQYIYHGNDGTSMPWNDTAQLDYLNPEAREAVIQQILQVARRCSIIRFDAAMTLVKEHIQRLWYPEPGSGGAIPSRAEYGMSAHHFERIMPREFWVEVVDRVAQEAPDTLLLAEAFWMMEGYFVRSLGMHRVYNSAFMNMLSDEDNAGYRRVMKETLEFDPEILRRYVNFMNNPDEETALAQFGRGDKYFGVFALMATMPGLPMIGHGQIEGFAEKYGMDFNTPRLDERPDQDLIARHEREIFPLLRHRHLFAGVENFLLFDLYRGEVGGSEVDENVYAYSNYTGGVGSLVVYHNRYADTRGWLRDSAAFRAKSGELTRRSLLDGLGIEPADGVFVTFREQRSGLEYIRSAKELAERGFFVELGAYQRHIFMYFQAVQDTAEGVYRQLSEHLAGRGVPDLGQALRRLELAPLHDLLERAIPADLARSFAAKDAERATVKAHLAALDFDQFGLLDELKSAGSGEREAAYLKEVRADFDVIFALQRAAELAPQIRRAGEREQAQALLAWGMLLAWAIMRPLGGAAPSDESGLRARALWDEWSLNMVLESVLKALALGEPSRREERESAAALLRFALARQGWLGDPATWELPPGELFDALIADAEARRILRAHRHDDILWYHQESFEALMRWLPRFAAMAAALKDARAGREVSLGAPPRFQRAVSAIVAASDEADYQVERLRELLSSS